MMEVLLLGRNGDLIRCLNPLGFQLGLLRIFDFLIYLL